ncbi:SBBP repeat-containing protein [Candidatus Latescibacterota bacterium]
MLNRLLTYLFIIFLISLTIAVSAEPTYVLDESYGNVPVTFVPNVGQFDQAFTIAAEGNDGNGLLGDSGVVYQLVEDDSIYPLGNGMGTLEGKLYLQFMNANMNPEVSFEDPAAWNSNYFIGNDPEKWHTDVPVYLTARMNEIYPGIDLLLRGNGRDIEYVLAIKPGADPSQILFKDYTGVITGVTDGKLVGEKLWMGSVEKFVEPAPIAFQNIDGTEVPVALSFKFIYIAGTSIDNVAFGIGSYNHDYVLYIKLDLFESQAVMLKHTTDVASVEVDNEGSAYVAGSVEYKRNSDTSDKFKTLFAMRLNPDGDGLEYVTYFGSGGTIDQATKVTFDVKNNIYIAGKTSYDTFPTT